MVTFGLEKSTAETENSDLLDDVDYLKTINGVLDVSFVEQGTVMAE